MATVKKRRFFKRKASSVKGKVESEKVKAQGLSVKRKEIVIKQAQRNKRSNDTSIHQVSKSSNKNEKSQKNTSRLTLTASPSEKSPRNSGSIPEKPRKRVFPKIRRIITERIVWTSLLVGILLGVIILKLFLIQQTLQQNQRILSQRASIMKKVHYWQGITTKYPNYRDGFFELADLEYQLGNKKEAQRYINKTLQLDPNFGEAEKLRQIIGN